jgi:epoxide hydrolase-like predicted phosphatase
MIKNIVFDLGNVLISFKPSEYFDKKNYPENIKERVLNDIFGSKEWLMLDNGEITTPEVIEAIASKSYLKKEEIARIFNLRTELMYPLDLNIRLLPELKKLGFRLYYLSNFPLDIFEEVKSEYFFFRYFDGGIISAEAKYSKPDRRIYEVFLNKYSLVPEESLFIDDLEVNIKAAESVGMKGLVTFGSLEISEKIEAALSLSF